MSTVDKKFAERIIKNNGFYSESDAEEYKSQGGYQGGDNPRCTRLVEYTNAWGNKAYGASFEHESPEAQRRYMEESDFVRNPLVIWTYTPMEPARIPEIKLPQDLPPGAYTGTVRYEEDVLKPAVLVDVKPLKVDPNPQPLTPGQEEIIAELKTSTLAPLPYGGMPKAEDRKAVQIDPGNNLQVFVGIDGVWLHFKTPDGTKQAAIHLDTIGPQNKNSIIRQALNEWAGYATEAVNKWTPPDSSLL